MIPNDNGPLDNVEILNPVASTESTKALQTVTSMTGTLVPDAPLVTTLHYYPHAPALVQISQAEPTHCRSQVSSIFAPLLPKQLLAPPPWRVRGAHRIHPPPCDKQTDKETQTTRAQRRGGNNYAKLRARFSRSHNAGTLWHIVLIMHEPICIAICMDIAHQPTNNSIFLFFYVPFLVHSFFPFSSFLIAFLYFGSYRAPFVFYCIRVSCIAFKNCTIFLILPVLLFFYYSFFFIHLGVYLRFIGSSKISLFNIVLRSFCSCKQLLLETIFDILEI